MSSFGVAGSLQFLRMGWEGERVAGPDYPHLWLSLMELSPGVKWHDMPHLSQGKREKLFEQGSWVLRSSTHGLQTPPPMPPQLQHESLLLVHFSLGLTPLEASYVVVWWVLDGYAYTVSPSHFLVPGF